MKRILLYAPVLALAAGCGAPEPTAQVTFPAVLPITLDACAAPAADFADRLVAELRIGGGYPPCPLTVDTAAGTVSGTCPDITGGILRPIALVWSLTPPVATDPVVQLSYHVTYVDLRNGAEGADNQEVAVAFPDDATAGQILWRPSQLLGIDSTEILGDAGISARTCADAECLDVALAWTVEYARNTSEDPLPLLDDDGDDCPNLSEACQGGAPLLYSPTVNDTSPTCVADCAGDPPCIQSCCAYP